MNIFQTLLIQPLANGLIIFNNLLGGNFGLAIILFSLALRLILTPLTRPYMDSMKKMKDIAPQIEKLKKKYGNDKLKFSQAQADLYKEKGVNPAAGCLPYLLQIVILIAFFNMFSKVISHGDVVGEFNKLLYSPLKLAEGQIINTHFVYLDLTKPDIFKINFWPFTLPGLTIILSAIAQLVVAKVSQPLIEKEKKIAKGTKDSSDDMQVAMQQSMIYTMPLFTILIGMKFASALSLYWLTFSAVQVYQQVKSQGWGSLSPLIKRLKLIKSNQV